MLGRVVALIKKNLTVLYSVMVFIAVLFCIFKFRVVISHGNSMSPTIDDSEFLVCSKNFIFDNDYKVNDVVVAKLTSDVRLIKRIVAMGGDTLVISNGHLYVNGEKVSSGFKEDYPQIVVPEGKVFLIGDNINNSIDSRDSSIDFVDLKNEVIGKVLF